MISGSFDVARRSLVLFLLILPLSWLATAARVRTSFAQSIEESNSENQVEQAPHPLELGKPVEREMAGGDAHSYRIELDQGWYLRLMVNQRGIDVVVTLFAPDGHKIIEMDSPNGAQGPERLSLVIEAAGSHRLEVRSPRKEAAAGRYQAIVAELRVATA